MESFLSKKMFFKYIYSCLLVFAIPVTIIIIAIYSMSYNLFSRELHEKDAATLRITLTNVNHTLNRCVELNKQFTYTDNFLPFELYGNPKEGVRVIETLQSYVALNPQITDILVHFYNDAYVYTSFTSTTVDDTLNWLTQSSMPHSEVISLLKNPQEPTGIIVHMPNTDPILAFVTPLSLYSQNVGVMVFLLDISTLTTSNNTSPTHITHLLTKDYLAQEFDSLDLDFIPTLTSNFLTKKLTQLSPENDVVSFSLDNFMIYGYTPFNVCDNLIFLSFANNDSIFGPIQLLNSSMLLIILISLILALIISIYLLQQNNTPLDYLTSTLSTLSKHNTHLATQVNETIPLQKHFLLAQIVSGQVSHLGEFTEKCAELGLYFTAPFHTILITRSHSRHFSLESTVIESIEVLQSTSIQYAYDVQHDYPNIDVYLIGSSSVLSLPKLELPAAFLYFGPSCTSISSMPKSYIEARTSADINATEDKQFESITEMLGTYKSYTQQLQTLLETKHFTDIPRVLLLVIQQMEEQDLNFILRKALCIEIIILFNSYFDTNQFFDYEVLDLFSLYKIQSYIELKEIFIEVTSEMLEIVTQHTTQNNQVLSVPLIQEYVRLHLDNPSLSSIQIAKYFYTSPQYLESFFLQHSDCTLDTYIQERRIAKACSLLIDTPYTLKIICEQVGFSHISSLISAFKLKYELTPGQYRSLHQNKEATPPD